MRFEIYLSIILTLALLGTGGVVMAMELGSPAFNNNDFIPPKYTCKGEDVSPELHWSDVPEVTKSLALICDDPDAPMGTWVHWVIYDIPADKTHLSEAIPKKEELPDGTKQGITDFRQVGYGGPCPPPGPVHRYFFKLYAVDTLLNLPSRLSKEEILEAIEGHVLAEAQLVGKFKR